MKKKGDFAQEIDDLMRSFCQPEIEQCKDIPIDMDKINDGIDMGIAYAKLQIDMLIGEDKLTDNDKQRIFETFSLISKRLASIARSMISLGGGDRLQEIGLQIVQHNLLSPIFAMNITSRMIADKSALIH